MLLNLSEIKMMYSYVLDVDAIALILENVEVQLLWLWTVQLEPSDWREQLS